MSVNRRRFLYQSAALGAAVFVTPEVFAEQLTLTPRQTEGPFYPDKMPLDVDNDLVIINDAITPAVGEITHLTGRVLDVNANPVKNAIVEIWQVDSKGVYIHTGAPRRNRRDTNFQGFGRFETGSTRVNTAFGRLSPCGTGGRGPLIFILRLIKMGTGF